MLEICPRPAPCQQSGRCVERLRAWRQSIQRDALVTEIRPACAKHLRQVADEVSPDGGRRLGRSAHLTLDAGG